MNIEKGLAGIPKKGFIKVDPQQQTPLSGAQKSALIRKGNELFNAGRIDQAKRIFLTTGYADGLVRLGDYYYKRQDLFEAIRMYWIAPAPEKKEMIVERMATTVQQWLKEDGVSQNE